MATLARVGIDQTRRQGCDGIVTPCASCTSKGRNPYLRRGNLITFPMSRRERDAQRIRSRWRAYKKGMSPPAGRPRILSCIQPPALCVTVSVMLIVVGPLALAASGQESIVHEDGTSRV